MHVVEPAQPEPLNSHGPTVADHRATVLCNDENVDHAPGVRWAGVCIDCADDEELATFYSRLLDWETTASDGKGWRQLSDPSGGVGINVQRESWYQPPTWPEQAEAQHKMMHFDIEVDDLDEAMAVAIAAGGKEAPTQPQDRDQQRIRVLLDPAGHPPCLFVAGE